MRIPHGCLLVCLLTLTAVTTTAQTTVASEERVRHLMELTGAEQMGFETIDAMIARFSDTFSDVEPDFWTEFRSEIKPGDLVTLLVPGYQRHYSSEDIEALITFLSSPLGRKFVEKQSAVIADSMEVGEKWGKRSLSGSLND